MKFKFAPSLPAQLEPSTFYLIAQGEELLEIHVTNADASAVRRIPLKEDIVTKTVSQADNAPDVTGPEYFWLEPSTGTLFVKYENNGNPVWVETTTTWAGITDKPATFPPSTHTHDAANITSGVLADARLPSTVARLLQSAGVISESNLNLASAYHFKKTISAATTFTLSNTPSYGRVYCFILEITNGGAFPVTWWANIKWPDGSAPELTVSGTDAFCFFTTDGGATWKTTGLNIK